MASRSFRLTRASCAAVAFAIALVVLAVSASGCEVLLGISQHETHEALASDASTTGDASTDASSACVLPASGDAWLRLGDFAPSLDRYDFCVHRTDGTSAIDDKPILASSGSACPSGVGYKELLAPIAIPAGTYAVSAVAAGAGCGAPIASMSTDVFVDTGGSVSVIALGASSGLQLKAYRESRPSQIDTKFRFIHAIDGAPTFDVGLTDKGALPAKIVQTFFASIPFTGTSPAGSESFGAIDSFGYLEASLLGADLQIGVAPAGVLDAILLTTPKFASKESYTILAIGTPNDVRFPEELVVCNEIVNDGIFTRCGKKQSVDLTMDVFDPYLWGPFGLQWKLRRGPAVAAIGQLDSDVACIPDLFPPDDQAALVAATRAHFPYVAQFKDGLTTPIDDPRDQAGNVPPPKTVAPCATLTERLGALLDCARDNCSTKVGDEAATLQDDAGECLSAYCTDQVTPILVSSGEPGKECWACAITSLEGDASIGDTRAECTTDPLARLAFRGGSGVTLLSRYPIHDPEQYVLPSTDWRSNVIRAPITIDNGAAVDTYCAILTSPVTGITRPYTGAYGNGLTDIDAWRAELMLQIGRVTSWVAAKSGTTRTRALVSGQFYAGPEVNGATAYNVDAYHLLTSSLPLAVARDFAPSCTFCADNPISTPPGTKPSGTSTWTSYTLLSNIPVTDVRASSIILTTPSIPYAGYTIPVSPYYGFRTSVRIAP